MCPMERNAEAVARGVMKSRAARFATVVMNIRSGFGQNMKRRVTAALRHLMKRP